MRGFLGNLLQNKALTNPQQTLQLKMYQLTNRNKPYHEQAKKYRWKCHQNKNPLL